MYDGDLQYLREGNQLQKAAYRSLQEIKIMQVLAPFDPLLCGTIPLNLQVQGSDLDIICEVADFASFAALLQQHFSHFPEFRISESSDHLTAAFLTSSFPLEVFGQSRPVREQHAYRHMVQEGRVLALTDENFRRAIIRLKKTGLSTEAAFASLLRLPGDPYAAILSLERLPDSAVRILLDSSVLGR